MSGRYRTGVEFVVATFSYVDHNLMDASYTWSSDDYAKIRAGFEITGYIAETIDTLRAVTQTTRTRFNSIGPGCR